MRLVLCLVLALLMLAFAAAVAPAGECLCSLTGLCKCGDDCNCPTVVASAAECVNGVCLAPARKAAAAVAAPAVRAAAAAAPVRVVRSTVREIRPVRGLLLRLRIRN